MKLSLGAYEDQVRARAAALVPVAERIWKRDAAVWGGDARRKASVSNRLGWLDVTDLMREEAQALEEFASQIRSEGYRDVVVLGMGGSSLAPEVLGRSIVDSSGSDVGLHILDTTDPLSIRTVMERAEAGRTLYIVSSKSGSTIEALSLFAYAHALVSAIAGDGAGKHFVAITDEGTPLVELAARYGFRRTFVNPADIGGRYSALSYFGLVPAAVAGIDIRQLIKSASAAAAETKTVDGLLLGAALAEFAVLGRDKLTFILSRAIATFGLWAEQLVAESTGKDGKGIVPVVGEPLLAPEAYSADRVFIYVRLASDDNAVMDSHYDALAANGHPCIRIDLDDVCGLGREFFRWEFAVAIAGLELGINPFDEPNVQESKDNTNAVLGELERSGRIESGAIAIDAADCTAQVRDLLRHLSNGRYFAITAFTATTNEALVQFDLIRRVVGGTYRVATTLGFGPRYLHSTGQLHKGGPRTGVFLQIVTATGLDDPPPDIGIPGKPFTFGQLKAAQAAGDREALVRHGLPVLTIDIGPGSTGLEALRGTVEAATRN